MTIDEAFRILGRLPDDWKTTEAEVQEVESRVGTRLPPPLRQLMLSTGRRVEWLFPDNDIPTLFELPHLQDFAKELLADDPPSLHPPFSFVTLSQLLGYTFMFLRAESNDDDPMVMQYVEGRGIQQAPFRLSIRQLIGGAVHNTLDRGEPPAAP